MTNVLTWLEATAERLPNKPAVRDVSTQLTFFELLERSRTIGTWLASRLAPCTPVALYLDKSPECLAAMLGAATARCCYAVLDTRQPAERLAHVVKTLQPGLVLTTDDLLAQATGLFSALDVQTYALSELICEPDADLLARLRSEALDTDPLYVNFTSGSTGAPKGVAIAHRSVIDFIPHFTSLFGITENDEIGNQAPFDFDVSVKDIFSCLSTGATLHLIPRAYFSEPVKLMDYLVDRKVTTCTWAVSAMCFVSIMGGFDYRVPSTINKVIFSGEVMPPKQLARWQKHLPDALYVNVYGPTEITCNCTYHVLERAYAKTEVIPMGKAFPNERVFLLSEDNHEVTAVGEQGEVCVCGTCVGLGYYNAPELTARAFVQNPLNTRTREVMYRTGDLAFCNEDGNLVYVGRKDHQIKHMGQRIELGEIEAVAQGFDGVSRAVCTYDAKRKRIALFYTGELGVDELRDELAEKLPHFMVPGRMERLEEMPLTKNGKVDRQALG